MLFFSFANNNIHMLHLRFLLHKLLHVQVYSLLMAGLNFKPSYYWFYNSLVIPPSGMQFPMFDRGNPLAVNYGGIGSYIANALIKPYDEFGKYLFSKYYVTLRRAGSPRAIRFRPAGYERRDLWADLLSSSVAFLYKAKRRK